MRRPLTGPAARATALAGAITVAVAVAAPADAATPAAVALPIAGLLDDITHTVLGGVDWTVDVAGDFILNLFGGIVKTLIPRSWINKGLEIMTWMVAVPDYAGQVTTPGGGRAYGFSGVNELRGMFTWLGVAIMPLTLLFALSRSLVGAGDPPAVPLGRVLICSVAVLSYEWLWGQAVALTNQITNAILTVGAVTDGIQKMFGLLVAGGGLTRLPMVGLIVMAAGALALFALLFIKVSMILVGALVYAVGPLMPGIAATERGNAIARAWMSLALALFVLPILWAAVFAVCAVLINDASTAGATVLGADNAVGQVFDGLLIAMAAIAGFWINLKITKSLFGLVGGQLSGMLSLIGGQGGGASAVRGGMRVAGGTARLAGAAGRAAGASLRSFPSTTSASPAAGARGRPALPTANGRAPRRPAAGTAPADGPRAAAVATRAARVTFSASRPAAAPALEPAASRPSLTAPAPRPPGPPPSTPRPPSPPPSATPSRPTAVPTSAPAPAPPLAPARPQPGPAHDAAAGHPSAPAPQHSPGRQPAKPPRQRPTDRRRTP